MKKNAKMSDILKKNESPTYYDRYLDTDSEAFINPILVCKNKKKFSGEDSENAEKRIDSFFEFVMGNKAENLSKIDSVPEENATGLGYSKNKSVGHGPNKDLFHEMLNSLNLNTEKYSGLAKLNGNACRLSALTMFVPGFSYDSVSDLTTRLIEKELYNFTIETVKRLGRDNSLHKRTETLYYWADKDCEWKKENVEKNFYANGKFTLLVPNCMVEEKKFKKNPDDYIRNVIAPRIINDRLQKTGKKPKKKQIIDKAKKDAGGAKRLIENDIAKYPNDFIDYYNNEDL
ncbi:hypothetical protein [Fructilactobacillus florum]|uniref:hypothetical protein n=1 Tax=Fructilactobacillus florum TaxID=640331 RepID=UPI000704DFB6|nr:hypothetical protein [Fructilactobacillus florum]